MNRFVFFFLEVSHCSSTERAIRNWPSELNFNKVLFKKYCPFFLVDSRTPHRLKSLQILCYFLSAGGFGNCKTYFLSFLPFYGKSSDQASRTWGQNSIHVQWLILWSTASLDVLITKSIVPVVIYSNYKLKWRSPSNLLPKNTSLLVPWITVSLQWIWSSDFLEVVLRHARWAVHQIVKSKP